MLKQKERVEIITKRLNEIFPKPPIPLIHNDEFTLLIAVLLSAQSTDKKVNELSPALFKIANTPESMVAFGEKNIYNKIKQLGLSKTKAKNIYNLSIIILNQFCGQVPKSLDELESLPGVGHKTASVVMAQAFDVPTFPVDTHIHRLAQRWGLTNGQSVKQTEKDLKRHFPRNCWNKLHLQIIYYGREFCTARGCDGTVCDICKELYPNRTQAVKYKKA